MQDFSTVQHSSVSILRAASTMVNWYLRTGDSSTPVLRNRLASIDIFGSLFSRGLPLLTHSRQRIIPFSNVASRRQKLHKFLMISPAPGQEGQGYHSTPEEWSSHPQPTYRHSRNADNNFSTTNSSTYWRTANDDDFFGDWPTGFCLFFWNSTLKSAYELMRQNYSTTLTTEYIDQYSQNQLREWRTQYKSAHWQ